MSVDRFIIIPAMIGVAAAGAVPANAKSPGFDEQSIRVSYADLNLGSPAGSQVLESRVRAAIEISCERPDAGWNDWMAERQCARKAATQAEPQVALAIRNAKQALAMNDSAATIVIH